jgi:hypothetical protein
MDDDEAGRAQMTAVRHRHLDQATFRRIAIGTADAGHAPGRGQLVDAGPRERQRTAVGEASTRSGVAEPDDPSLSPRQRPAVVDDDPRHGFLPSPGPDGSPDTVRADAGVGQLAAVGDPFGAR